MLRSLGPLLAGIVTGATASWAFYKARIRAYQAYIHERIEGQLEGTMSTMTQKPELIIRGGGQGIAIVYQCSFCGRQFPLDESETPKEAMAKLYTTFKTHVRQEHPDNS
jgi:hypothetical protein